jgi:hypothetical protein
MSVFKRRKKDQLDTDAADEAVEAAAPQDEDTAPAAPGRPQGPWDAADAPEREVPRLDLGALQVPVSGGLEVRVDVDAQGQVVAATLVKGPSALQLSVFAAPRTDGIWDEVREEIASALGQGGGQATPADGPFGTELRASVPTQVPDRGVMLAPARFLGVDGPRWFVRGLMTGAGAADPAQAEELEQAFRDVVVVRGGDPMAVRDPLPLRLPPDVSQKAGQAAAEARKADQADQAGQQPARAGGDPLPMPERGPEITEIR